MVAILADIIILALILGYCAYLVYGIVKRFKNGVIQGCGGSCAGCSGCGGGCCSSDPDEVKKMIEICMVNKGVGSHGQFDRLYVLPVRDRDRPLHCRCFYLSGISLVQEMAGEKKRRKVQHG